eukprot:scaffold84137_cov63-Phaeocystis_antarctica.AAC.2
MNGRASSCPSVPYPAPTSPYSMVASERRSPDGNGTPTAPATARPRTATPTRVWQFCSRSSTNSRVPSSGST